MIHGSGPDGKRGFVKVFADGTGGGGSTVPGFFLHEELLATNTNNIIQSFLIIYEVSVG
jgi:hypothetical protein